MRIRHVLLMVGGFAFAVVCAEVALRLLHIDYPIVYRNRLDAVYGWTHMPDVDGTWREEGEGYFAFDADGFRNRSHSTAKPRGTYRVAVLGDSFTEALQVPVTDSFPEVLERDLDACAVRAGFRSAEVLNFAVSGYGTAQELLVLRNRVWGYAPDVVILAAYLGNDIIDNSMAPLAGSVEPRPYFELRNGQLTLDTSFNESAEFRARTNWKGRAYEWVKPRLRVLQLVRRGLAMRTTAAADPNRSAALPGADITREVLRPPTEERWKEAWALTEALFVQMNSEVRAHGARFLMVALSVAIQAHPDPQVRDTFMRENGISNMFYPDDRVRALGERNGFDVLALAPVFQSYAERHHTFLHGFGASPGVGHWNAQAHHLAGDTIARAMCDQLGR